MKLNSKVLLAVVTVAASGLGFASSAFAQSIGVGGVAGSASFQLNAGKVQSAAVSAAVGKDTAYAGANAKAYPNDANPNFLLDAFAVGTGGEITTTAGTTTATTAGSNYVYKVGPDADRATAQKNLMGGGIGIDATSGQTIGGNVSVTTAP